MDTYSVIISSLVVFPISFKAKTEKILIFVDLGIIMYHLAGARLHICQIKRIKLKSKR